VFESPVSSMGLSTPTRDWSREPDRSHPVAGAPLGVLVVDDDPSIRALFTLCLPPQGFAVWGAASGEEALDVYREHGSTIDVVLLDVRMPDLDGPHTLARLRQFDPEVRCCFMSGDIGDYTEDDLFALGALDVVAKPFSLTGLGRRLRQVADGELVSRA
jgi:CheY-like chemotaxis protein